MCRTIKNQILITIFTVILVATFIMPVSAIIKSSDYMSYNNYQQDPVQSEDDINQVPDCVEIGDILMVDVRWDQSSVGPRPGPHNEHAALYIGGNYFIHAGGDLGDTVCVKNYSRFYTNVKNFAFVRVKTANQSQRQAAVDWAMFRQCSKYQYWDRFPWYGKKIADPDERHPTANSWYCFELVWAAYYNQGIDIDSTGWELDPPYNLYPWVHGDDILNDDDVEIIYRCVNDSTEIVKPSQGIYIFNKKIVSTFSLTVIFGKVDLEVNMVDSERIEKVNFYIDNKYVGNDTAAPFNWTWSNRCFGKKVITAEAIDKEQSKFYTNFTVYKLF